MKFGRMGQNENHYNLNNSHRSTAYNVELDMTPHNNSYKDKSNEITETQIVHISTQIINNLNTKNSHHTSPTPSRIDESLLIQSKSPMIINNEMNKEPNIDVSNHNIDTESSTTMNNEINTEPDVDVFNHYIDTKSSKTMYNQINEEPNVNVFNHNIDSESMINNNID